MDHIISRRRHDAKLRNLTVAAKEYLTPHMIRILFKGDDVGDFVSDSADDHVKLLFPAGEGRPEMRDYTPRHYDREARTLTIDFAVHDAGPATQWAINAGPGDELGIGGPRGSMLVSPTFDWWLLVGDETALPAIGRRLEEARDARMISVAAIAGPDDQQDFAKGERQEAIWVHRPTTRNDDPEPLLAALRNVTFPDGDGFIWIAAEARVARAVRDYITGERGHPSEWMKAAGYWVKGVADAHEKLQA